jgi:hypothetical protein
MFDLTWLHLRTSVEFTHSTSKDNVKHAVMLSDDIQTSEHIEVK